MRGCLHVPLTLRLLCMQATNNDDAMTLDGGDKMPTVGMYMRLPGWCAPRQRGLALAWLPAATAQASHPWRSLPRAP